MRKLQLQPTTLKLTGNSFVPSETKSMIEIAMGMSRILFTSFVHGHEISIGMGLHRLTCKIIMLTIDLVIIMDDADADGWADDNRRGNRNDDNDDNMHCFLFVQLLSVACLLRKIQEKSEMTHAAHAVTCAYIMRCERLLYIHIDIDVTNELLHGPWAWPVFSSPVSYTHLRAHET